MLISTQCLCGRDRTVPYLVRPPSFAPICPSLRYTSFLIIAFGANLPAADTNDGRGRGPRFFRATLVVSEYQYRDACRQYSFSGAFDPPYG